MTRLWLIIVMLLCAPAIAWEASATMTVTATITDDVTITDTGWTASSEFAAQLVEVQVDGVWVALPDLVRNVELALAVSP